MSEAALRAVFFGTPTFAVPTLEALLEIAEVVAVVTQPDRPQGRGMKLTPPPIKVLAEAHGIDVVQPIKVRTADFAEQLVALEADIGVVVAYGRILPRAVLEAPAHGCVNVHASLLPRWRGAAPIQWSIVDGDSQTGVSLMKMDEGMDTGPLISFATTDIDPDETSAELSDRLSRMGADLLRHDLLRFVRGELVAIDQDASRATMARMLEKRDGELDFAVSARAVHDRVRGMSPWPGAYTFLDERGSEVCKVWQTRVIDEDAHKGAPGLVIATGARGIEVACGHGVVAIEQLQLTGKRRMDAASFLAGHPLGAGMRLFGGPAAEVNGDTSR